MDFHSLNRRQLQSLCKINKIPANITNIAMAHALKSLHTVVGIEEIEITSPRVPCTSYRTTTRKKVKKSETDSVLATASRAGCGVRRQLAGEDNDFLKTPSVSNPRKKGTATSTSRNTVKRETTVQRVYNTRRSARLTEKKCTEAGVTETEISQPVKIASFLEKVCVTSEESVGSGCSSVETNDESSISFEKTVDSVGEECAENCDEGVSKENVEEICIEFEKLDVVVVDESDNVDIEEKQKVDVDCCGENVDIEEEKKVEEKFILNEPQVSEEKRDQVDNIQPDSQGISNPCEVGDSEGNMMVVDEKIDPHEALNVSANEHKVSLDPEEQYDNLLCDKVLSAENSEKVECCGDIVDLEEKQRVEEKFILNQFETSEEKNDHVDKFDPCEAFNVLVNEHDVYLPQEEHYDSLLCDKVLTEVDGSHANFISCDTECPSDSSGSVSEMKNEVIEYNDNNEISCELSKLDNQDDHVVAMEMTAKPKGIEDNGDHNSVIEKLDYCGENVDIEEKPEGEEKFIEASGEKGDQVDNFKPDSEEISNSCEDGDSEEKLMVVDEEIDPQDPLNKDHDVYLALEECDKALSEADGSDVDSISCDIENTSDSLGSVSEMISCIDPYEESNVSLKEHNVILASEEHADSLRCDIVLTESDGSNADSILFMKNEVSECNDSTNDNETPSELSKLDNLFTLNGANEMTAGPVGIVESISKNTVDEVLMNPNEQEQNKDFGISEEAQESLIEETALDIFPNIYQETEEKLADADNVPHVSVPDVIDHPTHLTPIKNQTPVRETSQVSDNNENSVGKPLVDSVEDGQIVKKVEDEKPTSLNETSMRQLKRQLKALSIKSNMSTNKDDMVADARPVLQPVCDNHLAPGEGN